MVVLGFQTSGWRICWWANKCLIFFTSGLSGSFCCWVDHRWPINVLRIRNPLLPEITFGLFWCINSNTVYSLKNMASITWIFCYIIKMAKREQLTSGIIKLLKFTPFSTNPEMTIVTWRNSSNKHNRGIFAHWWNLISWVFYFQFLFFAEGYCTKQIPAIWHNLFWGCGNKMRGRWAVT